MLEVKLKHQAKSKKVYNSVIIFIDKQINIHVDNNS